MTGAELIALVSKGSGELSSALIEAYIKRKLEHDPEKTKQLKSNINPHIEATFNKCRVIKTLLNPLTPANFLAIYATQRFNVSQKQVDHYGMVEYVRSGPQNIIISGSGGSGKSMFTRYLWLSFFVQSDGKIPLFIELRNINSISIDNFLIYINYSIAQGAASLNESDFNAHLKNGDFVVILDGFDEVVLSKRESIQTQIISMAENYPKLKIILTSRPDDRFGSWPSFEVAAAAPLHKSDVIELIEKAEFDIDSKNLFLKRIRTTDLYDKHRSFLTNPLLASMMLLTFSHKFDIPDKMHLFYQQAFDALFQRHDSHKPGGYKREFKTKLSEDAFKRIISYFCLITYNGEKFIFTRDQVIEHLKTAIKITTADTDPSALLEDLILCVCFLIRDGIHYTFSHRSFQEYFTAQCLTYLKPEQFRSYVTKFSKRVNDQVILLLADISPDLLRRNYILPLAERFDDKLQLNTKDSSAFLFFAYTSIIFDIQMIRDTYVDQTKKIRTRQAEAHVYLSGGSDLFDFVLLSVRLFRRDFPSNGIDDKPKQNPSKFIMEIFKGLKAKQQDVVSITMENGRPVYYTRKKSEYMGNAESVPVTKTPLPPEIVTIFEKSFLFGYLLSHAEIVSKYVSEQRKIEESVSDAMDNLFKDNE